MVNDTFLVLHEMNTKLVPHYHQNMIPLSVIFVSWSAQDDIYVHIKVSSPVLTLFIVQRLMQDEMCCKYKG